MELFKKFLLPALSFGIILSSAPSSCVFDVERGLPGSGNVSFTRLIDTYLSTDGGKKCR